jgi:hypothetical protein
LTGDRPAGWASIKSALLSHSRAARRVADPPAEQGSALRAAHAASAPRGTGAVQVLAANGSSTTEPFPLGHRQPLVPPFGAVFMADAPVADVEEWLARAPDDARTSSAMTRC